MSLLLDDSAPAARLETGDAASPRRASAARGVLGWSLALLVAACGHVDGGAGDADGASAGRGSVGLDSAAPSSGGSGSSDGSGGDSNGEPPKGKREAKRRLDEKRAAIRALAEENATCGADEDCAALAFGNKPCGGPWEYLAYAPGSSGAAELESAVEDFYEAEAAYNSEHDVISDCAFLMEPDVRCDAGTCALVPY